MKEKLAETQSDPPTAEPSRVTVDEKQIEVDGEKKWLYAAIDTDSKLLLEAVLNGTQLVQVLDEAFQRPHLAAAVPVGGPAVRVDELADGHSAGIARTLGDSGASLFHTVYCRLFPDSADPGSTRTGKSLQ